MKDDNKAMYLQMIQNTIDRMSTNAAIFKGFAASTVAGASILNQNEVILIVSIVYCLPLAAFLALDLYYLSLERKFRYLYNQVKNGNHKIDYSMEIIGRQDKAKLIAAKARIRDCILSPSIYLFYPAMLVTLIVSLSVGTK